MKNSAILWNGITNKQFIIWLMRVSFIIFLSILTSFQLMAVDVNGQSMSEQKVAIRLEDETLLTALKRIEAQTTFRFYYRKAEIRGISGLHLEFNTRSVENTLYELLKNSDFSFKQIENNILLRRSTLQDAYTIKGRVLGSNSKPVEFATISITKVSNPQIKFSALADTGGRFNLKVYERGDYLLKISSLETDSLIQTINIGASKELQLPDLVLNRSAIQLKNVAIKGTRPLISRSIDKLTLNIEGSAYENGENALRLFSVIPGVNFDGKDIRFRGDEGVTVYVDNRRMLLPGDQLLGYLRSIPSESIKSFELKIVPGAENDAQNSGVIVNIVLKSEFKYGLSGNVKGGFFHSSENNVIGSTFLNYRAGKFNIQGGFNYRRWPAFYEDHIEQVFHDTGVASSQDEKYFELYNSIAYNASVDYKLDQRQTIGLSYNMFSNPGDIRNSLTTDVKYFSPNSNAADSSLFSERTTRFSYSNHMANAFYRNKLDTMGGRLDIGYSFIYYDLNDPSALETRFLNDLGQEFHPRDNQFTKTRGRSTIHVFNADLEKHLSPSTVINAGGKFTGSITDYTMDYRNGLTEQSPLDPLQSDRFKYNEHILAFYGTLAQTYKQWGFKIGLRAEQTNYEGISVTTGQTIGRNQWNLFPSAYLNRKLGENHSYTLSYNRRIERPGFRQLNPFISYANINTVESGNPDLVPYFSNNLQFEYLLKNRYSFTLGYQNTENGIAANVTNLGDVIVSKNENISDNNNVFTSFYIPVKLTKWWEFNTNTTLRYRTLDVQGSLGLHREKFIYNMWAANKFTLPGKYYIEVSGNYISSSFRDLYDQFNEKSINILVKKSFFKDRLNLTSEIWDPFHLYKPRYEINTPEFSRNVLRNKVDYARYIGLSINYNFSSGKKQSNTENVDAAGNEARRRL
ncbi:outer membrane beta-barrel family protein [Pedobacter metabolipauper]|uniref:Carboxypeptidase family protein n=1 Tax=Pedobacter metabolipauper TaxID=425513 RepID=A0A4R6SV78_9SPHI|nr:outer membrane beta-barrel family protein [Pedobacter metabolipauper]TDQ08660.1 carboxypeptidase family protein [Pedobacter metabolipauper]